VPEQLHKASYMGTTNSRCHCTFSQPRYLYSCKKRHQQVNQMALNKFLCHSFLSQCAQH